MADLIDLYNQGIFSKDEEAQQAEPEEKTETKEKKESTPDLLGRLKAGRNFFSEYFNIFINRRERDDTPKEFSLEDLYSSDTDKDREYKRTREEKEREFLANRKKDFITYVNLLKELVDKFEE